MSERKMVECEEPEYTSSHRQTKAATTYKATLSENVEDQQNNFPQVKLQRKNHIEKGGGQRHGLAGN